MGNIMVCETTPLVAKNEMARSPQVIMVGISHKSAPVQIREALALDKEEAKLLMNKAKESFGEGFFLSTCNRAELYAVAEDPKDAANALLDLLISHSKQPNASLERYFYIHSGAEAVQHLFGVAAGLDSMIVGEDQILGQVRRSFEAGITAGSVGPVLSQLARQAISVGKKARTETDIGRRYASVGHRAVAIGEQHLGGLKGKTVLAVGAGKMGRMVGKALRQRGVSDLLLANRTFDKACALAERFDGIPVAWEALAGAVAQADLVISCTGSSGFVLSKDLVERAMEQRLYRPLVMVDIAVPRDVDPAVGHLSGVCLYDVDHLVSVEAEGLAPDLSDIAKVLELVQQAGMEFQDWQRQRASVPVIRALLERAESVRQAELEKSFRKCGFASDRERQAVEAMTSAIVNKVLHPILIGLKKHDIDSTTQDALRSLVETGGACVRG